MNLLLFSADDIGADGLLTIGGRQAEHILRVLRLKPGQQLRVGEINGKSGCGRLIELIEAGNGGGMTAKIRLELLEPASTVWPAHLLIALPRPQLLKKVLQTGAMFGVARMVFFGCARVEKSYWSSKMLRPDAIRENLLLGMEQGEVTHLPAVEFQPDFRTAVAADNWPGCRLIYADRGSGDLLAYASQLGEADVAGCCPMLAIGPEGGWIERERVYFESCGYSAVGLGECNLRVDVAVAAALSQMSLLRFGRSAAGIQGAAVRQSPDGGNPE